MCKIRFFRIGIAVLIVTTGVVLSCRHSEDPVPGGLSNKKLLDSLRWYDARCNELRFTDPNRMHNYADRIVGIAKELQYPAWECTGYNFAGTSLVDVSIDSSFYYYRLSLQNAEKYKLEDKQAYALYCIGWLNNTVGNYRYAMLYLDSSITLATRTRSYTTLYYAWNIRGSILSDMNDSANAVEAYRKSIQAAADAGRKDIEIMAGSNLINWTIRDTLEKRAAYKKILAGMRSRITGNEQEMASILNNLSNLYTEPDSVMKYLLIAKKLIAGSSDAGMIAGINNSLAYAYLDKGDSRQAEKCLLNETIPMLEKSGNYDWLVTVYDSYGDVLKEMGRYEEAIRWKEKSMFTKSVAERKVAGNQVRLLNAMLDLKNKEREILIQQERVHAFRQNLLIAGLVILALVMLIFWLLQRHRARLHKEQFLSARKFIELEENEKDRTARDLHDITGEFILSISSEIEKTDFPDPSTQDSLIDKVEEIGESLRQISHRLNKSMVEKMGFNELIAGYCAEFSRISGLPIELELPEGEFILRGDLVLHIYRIVQELLSNAAKYARDGMVMLKFTTLEKKLVFSYRDTGPGFDSSVKSVGGMGFSNITERVKLLGGKATVDSTPGDGVYWNMVIPLKQ